MNYPLVTIIIPTYKDWERLRLCIDGLEQQTYPAEFIQVIIINNAPNSFPPDNYYIPKNTIIINEYKPGSYAARNTGITRAYGEIIGFTDSDCIPAKKWVESAINIFRISPDIERIGGKVELFFSGSKASTPSELYESVYSFRQEMNTQNGISVTANMFTRSDVFNTVGLFNDNLFSGGDAEWGYRAEKKNLRIVYSADTIVKHPARNIQQIIKKSIRVASAKGQMNKSNYYKETLWLLYQLLPKTLHWEYIKINGKHLSFIQRVIVYGLKWFSDIIRIIERLRMLNGGKPYNDVK